MRLLGDEYVRNEFKLHKTAKAQHVNVFFSAWEDYLVVLKKQNNNYGIDIKDKDVVLNSDQKQKMDELREQIRSDQ